jgi:DNA-nicking Smr family endonuclease
MSPDEAELWKHATRTLERVKAKARVPDRSDAPMVVAPRPVHDTPPAAKAAASARAGPPASIPSKQGPPSAPLPKFERRKAKQIAGGKAEIGARVDLHGLRQADARSRLRAFLLEAHGKGHRTVLVITGKGGEQGGDRLDGLLGRPQRGVLRRSVPGWLEEPDMRALVLSYTQAGVRHGGAGALYVQLRKGGRSSS